MANLLHTSGIIRRFASSQSGGTAVVFALSLVPLLIAGGVAIDYLRLSEARTELQAALDAGALAVGAAKDLDHDQRILAGTKTFERNMTKAGKDLNAIDYEFELDGQTVTGTARYDLPTGLMQVVGYAAMGIEAETEITVPDEQKAEVALVLDYSGSMTEISDGQVKYVAMKNAAKKLITDLETTNEGKVKFGLVPFSHHVYATLPKAYVTGTTGSGDWTGCTQDRRYPHNLTDATPTGSNATKWGHPHAPVHSSDGCWAYAPKSLKVAPLTEDFDALRTQLDNMQPYAWTHIALGAEFGYHLLSPNAPFTEGAPYSDDDTSKFLVILTDGRQTEPAFGPSSRTVSQGEDNLEAICSNAKASGITVMTIAFDLQDEDTTNRLRDCASDPAQNFMIAEDSSDIAAAFADIREQITAQVFISR